jgi:hypothetical protein
MGDFCDAVHHVMCKKLARDERRDTVIQRYSVEAVFTPFCHESWG